MERERAWRNNDSVNARPNIVAQLVYLFFLTTPRVFVFHCERHHRHSLPLVQRKIEYHGAYCTYVNIVTVKGLSRSRHGKIKEATISRMLNNICGQDKYTCTPACLFPAPWPSPERMNNLSKLVGDMETTRHSLRFPKRADFRLQSFGARGGGLALSSSPKEEKVRTVFVAAFCGIGENETRHSFWAPVSSGARNPLKNYCLF